MCLTFYCCAVLKGWIHLFFLTLFFCTWHNLPCSGCLCHCSGSCPLSPSWLTQKFKPSFNFHQCCQVTPDVPHCDDATPMGLFHKYVLAWLASAWQPSAAGICVSITTGLLIWMSVFTVGGELKRCITNICCLQFLIHSSNCAVSACSLLPCRIKK